MRFRQALSLLVLVGAGCRPEVGPPISQIDGPAILAVKGIPAEVDPKAVSPVSYEALAVDRNGRVPGPGSDIADPLLWAVCDQPKPPTENNSVTAKCLDGYALPGVGGPSPTTFTATLAVDACSMFGPSPLPAGPDQPAIRARDADVTGGYYQPVRVELLVPEGLRRAGMSTGDSLISFQLQRIYCGLKRAPGPIIREYAANYNLNNNPVLTSLVVEIPGTDPFQLPASTTVDAPVPVPVGQDIALATGWSADSVETYPAFDVIQRVLVYHREAIRVSWYATGGSFAHDTTGRGEDETDTYAVNTWKGEAVGLVHAWVVLHDSRGGTDFAAFDLDVTP